MDPGRPSPKHAHRFARIATVWAQRWPRRGSTVSLTARLRCGQSVRRSRMRTMRRLSPRERPASKSSRDVSDPTRGPRTLTPVPVRGSLTSRLLETGLRAKARRKCTSHAPRSIVRTLRMSANIPARQRAWNSGTPRTRFSAKISSRSEFRMTERSLQVTYRKGKPFSAYLQLAHETRDRSVRSALPPTACS